MGRPKKELKQIHRKKVKKAKKKVNEFIKGQTPINELTQHAKHFLKKQKKAKRKSI